MKYYASDDAWKQLTEAVDSVSLIGARGPRRIALWCSAVESPGIAMRVGALVELRGIDTIGNPAVVNPSLSAGALGWSITWERKKR